MVCRPPTWFFLALLAAPALGCARKAPPAATPPATATPAQESVDDASQRARTATWVELANGDLARGRYRSAIRRAEAALAENAQSPDAHTVLGAAHWRAGDVEASTAAYETALAHEPLHFGATLGLGRNLQARGALERAAALQDPLLAQDPNQAEPLLLQLWSRYALADAKAGTRLVDRLFELLPADDPSLPRVQAIAAFLRPLASQGPLCIVTGTEGRMDAALNHDFGLKISSAVLGETFARIIVAENRDETLIDTALASELGLSPIAELVPLGGEAKQGLVVIPELRFGDLKLEKVPALVTDLSPYTAAVGERPGIVLGRQALYAFGSVTFDFHARTFVIRREPLPPSPLSGEFDVPLLMLDLQVIHVPVVPVRIDGSTHDVHVYWGGVERSSLAVTRKAYLQSGHLPRQLEPLDDPTRGLKMVYLSEVSIARHPLGGAGGLVLTQDPPDPTLDLVLQATAFEVGGYLNTRMMTEWAVTYALPDGRLRLRPHGLGTGDPVPD